MLIKSYSLICACSFALLATRGQAAEQLLIKWRNGPESLEAATANSQIGSAVVRNLDEIGWQVVTLRQNVGMGAALEHYRALPGVIAVEPNRSVKIEIPIQTESTARLQQLSAQPVTPNDPRFSSQWNMRKISAPAAWQTTTGSTNIVVALIDTGVDYTHPDLAANIWTNPGETGLDANGNDKATNGIDDDGDGYIDDVHGIDIVNRTGDPMDVGFRGSDGTTVYHGTQLAGIIGAVGNNNTGIAGINWAVQIMAVRMGRDNIFQTESPSVFISHFVAAWDYVLKMKRRGVNIRVTSNSYNFLQTSLAFADAISAAADEGILAVFGAGNDGADQDVFTIKFPDPFNLPSLINVAASTSSDTLASFSNFGRSTVHLAGPGDNILSTSRGGGYQGGNSGTSQACPHVAGAAALLLSAYPNLTVGEIKAALLGSVDAVDSLRGKVITGGRLNLARALDFAARADTPPIAVTASPAGQRNAPDIPLRVVFNHPMDRASVEAALQITPSLEGVFDWENDSTSFRYVHAGFNASTNYTVRILGSARDASGRTLDGNFNQKLEGSPTDDFIWTFRFPLLNDDFANAQPINGSSGTTSGSNRYALIELSEPNHADSPDVGASVWYSWTPPDSGWYTFDLTSGTSFDSLLAVYTGNSLDQLASVASNDNYASRQSSHASFQATAGTRYSIVIAGKSPSDATQSGLFTLSWYPTPPPGFTGSQFFPSSAPPGAKIILTGTNFTGASAVLFDGASAVFTNASGNNLDLRITAVVPPDATSGLITIVTPHGNVTSTVSFQPLPPPLQIRTSPLGVLEITWTASTNAFVLESTRVLENGSWTEFNAESIVENSSTLVIFGSSGSSQFFRLRAK